MEDKQAQSTERQHKAEVSKLFLFNGVLKNQNRKWRTTEHSISFATIEPMTISVMFTYSGTNQLTSGQWTRGLKNITCNMLHCLY